MSNKTLIAKQSSGEALKNNLPYPELKTSYRSPIRQLISEHRDLGSKMLCLYDGIKMRVEGDEYIDFLLQPKQRYRFKIKENTFGSVMYYTGRYANFDLHIQYTPQGYVTDISGSVHKFFNKGKHNYNDYTFIDFLKVIERLCKALRLEVYKTQVVSLEVGANLDPSPFHLRVEDILERVLFLFNKCNNRERKQEKSRDSLKVVSGERYIKIYDKGLQYKQVKTTLRMEIGYRTSRALSKQAGVKYLSDIMKTSTHVELRKTLLEEFASMHIYEPTLLEVAKTEAAKNLNLYGYGSANFWCNLKRTNRRQFHREKMHRDTLLAKYQIPDTADNLLRLLKDKIS